MGVLREPADALFALPEPRVGLAALAALVKQDVVMKDGQTYVVTDSLYREWVARKTY